MTQSAPHTTAGRGVPEPEFTAVVREKKILAEGVAGLALARIDGVPLPPWRPGAHVDLILADGLVRQYSLCGDPADGETYRIAVLREQEGRGGSAHVHDAVAVGDPIRVRGPRNHFELRPAPSYLFVAGGIGITPLVPMIAEAEAEGAEWRLLYGGRSHRSMAFLDTLSRYGDRVLIHPQDVHGLLDLPEFLGGPVEGTLVYGCGPQPLLKAMEDACAAWPYGTLHVERFAPEQPIHTDGDAEFEVVLARSGVTLTVGPAQTILECVEAAGVPVLSSCQEGTCGTCETEIIEGVPDHRDSVLTEDDRASGEVMMICVSRCRGERLVLDL